MTEHWSLGVLIGLPFLTVGVLVCLLALAGGVLSGVWDDYGVTGGGFIAAIASLALTGLLLGAGFGYWPWKASYHKWYPKTGVVTSVSSRFLGDGSGGTSQKFVVQFGHDPLQRFGCNDTRCSLVHTGDRLTLSCKRVYQWSAVPGWDCNYVRDEPSA